METTRLQDIFIKILCSELNETELDDSVKEQLTSDVISALFSLSKRHDLAHMVASALYKSGLLTDEELLSKYSREEVLSIYRYEQMHYAYGQICEIFDEANISYIPLKGAVIRPYYPKESMRTSCDIDILVKEETLDRAIDALTQKGFQCAERNYHDVSLYSPNNIHLELHFNIQENKETLDAVLKDAWLYATPARGGCHDFTKEFFLFYMFAHMSYHFLSGGCGIRSLMDIWIMEHKMGMTYEIAKELLEKAGIYQFAEEISNLVNVCFSDKPKDSFTDSLLRYIFDGGIYGSLANNIAINHAKTHVNLHYIGERIRIASSELAVEYPILKTHRSMYPFCWLHRSGKLGVRLIKRMFIRSKLKKNITDERLQENITLRNRLGL